MKNGVIHFVWLFLIIGLTSCGKSDKELLIGKWQCDQYWFEFFPDQTYNGGTSILTEVKGYKYSLNEKEHELNLYTKENHDSHYLSYRFSGEDSLFLKNKLSSSTQEIIYVREKKQQP